MSDQDWNDYVTTADGVYVSTIEADARIAELEQESAELKDLVNHWEVKARCYGDMVHGCSPALAKAGHPVDTTGDGGAVVGVKQAVESLARENAELRAIMNKLPKTADGVPIAPGMEVWSSQYEDSGRVTRVQENGSLWITSLRSWGHLPFQASSVYSTREAAEAAKGVGDE